MAEEVTKEKKSKNKHTGAKAAGGVLIAALLLGGGGYFGLGIGNPNGGLLPTEAQAEKDSGSEEKKEEVTEAATEKDESVLKISVKESTILYQGKEVSLSELETALLKDYKEGCEITLTDDHAIKASYDEVTALLTRLDLPYSE